MHHSIQFTKTTSFEKTSISRSPLRRGFLCTALALVLSWLALLASATASAGSAT
jgi:hypothetical protein